jgi:outer membrane protein assembly factor BamA
MSSLRGDVSFLLAGLLACLLLVPQSYADGIDTTRVRKTEKVKKSTGEIIADIPGEILKFPFYTLEFITHAVVFNPPVSEVTKLIDLGAEAKPYIPVAGYGSRSGLKFGFALRKLKNIAPTDFVKGKWYYSTNDYQSYKLESRIEKFFTDRAGLDLYFRYKKRPRESFYGIGMDSREDKEANYTLENTEFKAEVPLRTFKKLYVSLIGGYQITNLYDGRDPDLEGDLDSISTDPDFALEPGRLDGSRYVTFGASLEWDNRDSRGQPSRGTHAYASFIRYSGVNRSDGLDFSQYTVDLRQYLNIWRERIIAVRAYLQRFDANDANTRATPVYLTSTLGGKEALRGYSRGRYIDNDLAMVSFEYRYPIWDMFDAFIFLDEGRVYDNMTDEEFFADWKYSAGFGLRVWNPRTVIASFQVAWSDETTKIYFEMGAVW